MLDALRTNWDGLKDQLITRIDRTYGVFDGGTFKQDRFAEWLVRHRIPWIRLESGRLDLSDETFRQMSRAHPLIAPLRELRHTLSQMRLSQLAVGSDDRNRCLLSPFRARSGRNAPSNTKFIFGPSVWLRRLIRPTPGSALAYVDYSQQEFGIAAALSGDGRMQDAYCSGDPYLAFAKQAGAVPSNATKATHGSVRDLYKIVTLATQYGMQSAALATRIGQSESVAAIYCASIERRTARTGAGRMRRLISRWCGISCTPSSIGASMSDPLPPIARCAISRRKGTGANVFAWRAVTPYGGA